MTGLGWMLVQWHLISWVLLSLVVAGVFIGLIFIRITVPRFRVETLSRLGWATLLALLTSTWLVYSVGFLLA